MRDGYLFRVFFLNNFLVAYDQNVTKRIIENVSQPLRDSTPSAQYVVMSVSGLSRTSTISHLTHNL